MRERKGKIAEVEAKSLLCAALPYLKTLLHLHDMDYAPSMQMEDRRELVEIIEYIEAMK